MARDSISRRIAGDRTRAGFFAFIASLPPLAAMLGFIYLGYLAFVTPSDSDDNPLLWMAGIALLVFMFYLITRWTFASVRSALTPQRVQAMWLRRFHSERGEAFRTSRVIDQLPRHGIAPLTLQDTDVQLSFEQRRNRLAPTFWLFFVPIALLFAYLGYTAVEQAQTDFANRELPATANIVEALVQAFVMGLAQGAVLAIMVIVFVLAILGAAVVFFLFAAISGPIGAMFAGKRDEFPRLPRLLERLKRGKGRRGASIVRISDTHWREAVTSSLGSVDVAIIDLTDVSEHVAWEIGEAVRACGASRLVFICKEGVVLPANPRAVVRQALGREPAHVVNYPARRGGDAKRFAKALRDQICAAADMSGATKA